MKRLLKLWPFHNMEIGRIDTGVYVFDGEKWIKAFIGYKWDGGYGRGVPPNHKYRVEYNTVPNMLSTGEIKSGMPFNTIDMITRAARRVIANFFRED